MSEQKTIYQAIAATMRDCSAVTKDRYNKEQGYRFRGIDAVMNALYPAMTKNGIFMVPKVLDIQREERQSKKGGTLIYSTVTVEYTFYAEDGSSVTCITAGEGMDSGDKSINKAMSAAFKYAAFQTFCIPTEEMRDSEEDSPEVEPRQQAQARTTPARRAAQKATVEPVKQETLVRLEKALTGRIDTYDAEYVCRWAGVENLTQLTEGQALNVLAVLERK